MPDANTTRLSIIENRLPFVRHEHRVQQIRMQWLKEESSEWESDPGFLMVDGWLETISQKFSIIDNRLSITGDGLMDRIALVESCLVNLDELMLMVSRALDVLERRQKDLLSSTYRKINDGLG